MSRVKLLAVCGTALAALAVGRETPRLIWNVTPSAPVGLYWLSQRPPGRDEYALLTTPENVGSLAAARRYIAANVPLVKRIAGVSGDKICAENDAISINGVHVADRLQIDSQGRPMPRWSGCHVLQDEVFPLMAEIPNSFDGRYFGPVPRSAVIGKLMPLWTQ